MITDTILELDSRLPALIPTHNSVELLKHNFSIIHKADIKSMIYPIIIDDRSTEDIRKFCLNNGAGYIRIEHDFDFNYSLNINKSIGIMDGLVDNVLVLNNDCYLHSKLFLRTFIEKHISNKSSLSAIKLLYPPDYMSFKRNHGRAVDKVQFGDGGFVNNSIFSPSHVGILLDKQDPLVNSDRQTLGWVTGACNLINVKDFIEHGGYNESLSSAFQDVLLSIEYIQSGKSVFYFGEDIFFYHDESTTRMDDWNKNSQILYTKYIEEVNKLCQIS